MHITEHRQKNPCYFKRMKAEREGEGAGLEREREEREGDKCVCIELHDQELSEQP